MRHRQDRAFAAWNNQRDDAVVFRKLNTAYAGGGTAHGANGVFLEAYNLTGRGEQHHFILTRGQIDADQLIAFVQVDRDDTGGTRTAELGQRGFLHGTAGGGHKDVDALFVLADRQDGGNALIGFQRQQVDDRPTARAAAGFRQLIDLHPVQTAAA